MAAEANNVGTLGADSGRAPSRISLIPHFGASLFELSGPVTGSKTYMNQRIVGGLGVEIGRGHFRFETGLGYLASGTGGSGKAGLIPFNYELRSDFVILPVLFKALAYSDEYSSFFAKAGLTAALLVKSDFEANALGRSATEDVRDKANNVDWLLSLGMGGRFYLADQWDWVLEIMAYQGQVDATKAEGKVVYEGFTLTTGLAYRIPSGKPK